MKKKFLLVAIAVLIALNGFAQRSVREKHSNYRFDLASGLQFRVGAIYSNQLFTNKASNVGLDVGFMKPIYDWLDLRGLAQVNGFISTGKFDRYGKVMAGGNLNFSDYIYLYGDIGGVYNKNLTDDPLGLAFDAGLGVRIPLSDYMTFNIEAGTDRVQNRNKWTSTPSVTGAIVVETPMTDNDKHSIQIIDNQPKIVEELNLRNRAAEDQVRLYSKTLDTLNQSLIAANNMIGKLRKEIVKCEAERDDCKDHEGGDFLDIFFEYGSSSLTDIELDKVLTIAEIMGETNDNYIVYGYCSDDGNYDTNIELAKSRCNKVIKILEKLGIDSYRFLEIVPVGKHVTYGDGSGSSNRFVRIRIKK
jgi:outer membrane protein OmpA-like peptidoglycan-associated protein